MRRLIAILALIIMIMAAFVLSSARADGIPDATVATYQLLVRAIPSNRGAVVTILTSGTVLTLDGRDSSTQWVHGKADNGAIGWLNRAYLRMRKTLVVGSLPVMDGSAPTSAGSGTAPVTNSTPAPTTGGSGNTQAPPVVVSGHLGGKLEIGGQVQSLDSGAIGAMQRSGMKWVKQQTSVGEGGSGLIGGAHAAGFKILLSVVGDKNSLPDDGYQSTFASYVGGLAASGADAIEVGNEMNIDREWRAGAIDPALYVKLLAKSYNAIKHANPNTIVISGALAPTGAEGAFGTAHVWNDDRYYAGMAAAGAGNYADCIGVHYNEGIVGPNQASGDPRGDYPTRYFSTMLNRAIGPFHGKPACFTELGYLTPEGYGGLPGSFGWAANTTIAEQASWLAQAVVRASRSGQVRIIIIFNVNFTGYGDDPQAGYAMIRKGGGCPACDAVGAVAR